MKKYYFLILISVVVFCSCDKIEGPFIADKQTIDVDVEFPKLDPATVYRKVLLEEYTGHQCPNCPKGHEKAAELKVLYGDTLAIVAIHAGSFAAVDPQFPYDFTTTAGTQLYNDYAIGSFPAGIINRKPVSGGVGRTQWQNSIMEIDRSQIYAGIQLINKFDVATNILSIYSKTTMLKTYENPLQLSFFLIEDGIISPQLKGTEIIQNYVHDHVLRLGINGTYGERITPTGILEKDSAYTIGYQLDFKGKDWNKNNCTVVAILYDHKVKEVLQVETKKVIE